MNSHDVYGWAVVVFIVLAICFNDNAVAWYLKKLDAYLRRRRERRNRTPAQRQRQRFYWHPVNAFDAINRRNGERGLQ